MREWRYFVYCGYMKKSVFALFLAGLLLLLSAGSSFPDESKKKVPVADKKICITFNNLPAEQIYNEADRRQITRLILTALDTHNVTAAGFVVGENMESDWDIPVKWLEGGHALGTSTFSGQDITGVPVAAFIADIAKGAESIEDLLEGFNQKGRYFRYPYLIYGTDKRSKKEVTSFLADSKLKTAHVTIVVEDFVHNLALEKIYRSNDSTVLLNLRDEYLSHILERLARAETLAKEIMGRPIRHILQFRTNRLNALFLDDILSLFKEKGYKFISLKSALKDKVYTRTENYCGTKVISFLERLRLSDIAPCDDE